MLATNNQASSTNSTVFSPGVREEPEAFTLPPSLPYPPSWFLQKIHFSESSKQSSLKTNWRPQTSHCMGLEMCIGCMTSRSGKIKHGETAQLTEHQNLEENVGKCYRPWLNCSSQQAPVRCGPPWWLGWNCKKRNEKSFPNAVCALRWVGALTNQGTEQMWSQAVTAAS